MNAIRIDQVNIVVGDVAGAAQFLADLGVDVAETAPGWAAHHQTLPSATSVHAGHDLAEPVFGIDVDSGSFAHRWGGLDASFNGVVLNLRVDDRAEVDRLHGLGLSLGARSLRGPYDAFWGSRYAVVEGPGPLVIGIMSMPDPARGSAPPDPSTFG